MTCPWLIQGGLKTMSGSFIKGADEAVHPLQNPYLKMCASATGTCFSDRNTGYGANFLCRIHINPVFWKHKLIF